MRSDDSGPSRDGGSFDAILDAARQGERRAFERLYEQMNPRVHAFARARGAADPEGLVNEVFLQVFTALDRFEGSEPEFKAWVFRIARNKLIDEGRRAARRPSEVPEDPDHAARRRAADDVEDAVIGKLGTASALALLDELSEDQREVVLLRIFADLTVDAVADVIGKAPGAVKALQRRAFRTIARNLSQDPVPL